MTVLNIDWLAINVVLHCVCISKNKGQKGQQLLGGDFWWDHYEGSNVHEFYILWILWFKTFILRSPICVYQLSQAGDES